MPDVHAESVAVVRVRSVVNYQAYCATCGWQGLEYGDLRGAQQSGKHHKREAHNDGDR